MYEKRCPVQRLQIVQLVTGRQIANHLDGHTIYEVFSQTNDTTTTTKELN